MKYTKKFISTILFTISIMVLSSLLLISCITPLNKDAVNNQKEAITVTYFYNNPCGSCDKEKEFYDEFNDLVGQEKDGVEVKFQLYNTFVSNSTEKLEEYYKKYNVPKDKQFTPVIFIGDSVLIGETEIKTGLKDAFLKAKKNIIEKPSQKNTTSRRGEVQNKAIYFYVTSCSECGSVGNFFDALGSKYGVDFNNFSIEKLNISESKNLENIKKYFKAYKVPEGEQKVPIVFIGNTYLSGEKAIKEKFLDEIKKGSGLKTRNLMDENTSISLDNYKALGVFGAGLVNGLNPCSISMLLFFLSLLLVKDNNILKLGFSFCAGKYIAYVLLGTLFFNILNKINVSFLGTTSKIIILIITAFLVVFNLYDYFAAKNEKYDKIKLQLPKSLRKLNHEWLKKISGVKSIRLLVFISFALGMVISVGEFLCTGQVYLATIIYVLQESTYFNLEAATYFLLYGLAFIIPLVILTYFVYKFKETFEVSEFVRKKMHIIKLINAGLFLIFGLVVILWF